MSSRTCKRLSRFFVFNVSTPCSRMNCQYGHKISFRLLRFYLLILFKQTVLDPDFASPCFKKFEGNVNRESMLVPILSKRNEGSKTSSPVAMVKQILSPWQASGICSPVRWILSMPRSRILRHWNFMAFRSLVYSRSVATFTPPPRVNDTNVLFSTLNSSSDRAKKHPFMYCQ